MARSASIPSHPAGRCRSSRCPLRRERWKATPNIAQDDCESPRSPARRTAGASPPARFHVAGAIRVCDLFYRPLVLSFWFTKSGDCVAQQNAVNAVYERYRGQGELPLAGRARRPRNGPRTHPPARLEAAGRIRPRRRRRQPLQSRRLPDLRLRLSRRHPEQRQRRRPHRGQLAPGSEPAAGAPARRKRAEVAAPETASPGSTGPGNRAGSPPTSQPSSPASGSPGSTSTLGRARARRIGSCAGSATSPTAFSAPRPSIMRERPIPWAYRVFFRQIGLDPDRTRTPVEQLALDRLHDGAFKNSAASGGLADHRDRRDRRRLRAFDADRLEGRLCIRDSAPGESLPGRPGELAQGTLMIADERAPSPLSSAPRPRDTRWRAESRRVDDRRHPGQGRAPDRRRRGALDGCRELGWHLRSHLLTGSWLAGAAA